MDVIVNINVGPDQTPPKVVVKKKKIPQKKGGVVQFPEMPENNNPILDMMGIKET